MKGQTTFSLEYVLSLIVALTGYYLLNNVIPDKLVWIKILGGIFFGYVSLLIFNTVLPTINIFGENVSNYIVDKTRSTINYLDYLYIFPPLLVVLIIFFILLYSGGIE
jgi:hypothetical protein